MFLSFFRLSTVLVLVVVLQVSAAPLLPQDNITGAEGQLERHYFPRASAQKSVIRLGSPSLRRGEDLTWSSGETWGFYVGSALPSGCEATTKSVKLRRQRTQQGLEIGIVDLMAVAQREQFWKEMCTTKYGTRSNLFFSIMQKLRLRSGFEQTESQRRNWEKALEAMKKEEDVNTEMVNENVHDQAAAHAAAADTLEGMGAASILMGMHQGD